MMAWLRTLRAAALVAALARWLDRSGLHGRWVIGRLVEVGGDRVTLEGLTFSVGNALITTRQKGLIYLGLHESHEIALVHRHLVAGLPVIELGGGIGVVSCIINRKLAHPGDHIVVEANPDLIPTLETNRGINQCEFQIRNVALAYGGPEIAVAIDSFVASRIGGAGQRRVQVATTTLARLLQESGFARINLVADIEGAEVNLVEQEGRLVSQRVRTLIVETHPRFAGVERTARMLAVIESLGFAEAGRSRNVFAFENRSLDARDHTTTG
ncbi:MAG: FkbM family methyltransferase [Gemmatimonadales bacterium]